MDRNSLNIISLWLFSFGSLQILSEYSKHNIEHQLPELHKRVKYKIGLFYVIQHLKQEKHKVSSLNIQWCSSRFTISPIKEMTMPDLSSLYELINRTHLHDLEITSAMWESTLANIAIAIESKHQQNQLSWTSLVILAEPVQQIAANSSIDLHLQCMPQVMKHLQKYMKRLTGCLL